MNSRAVTGSLLGCALGDSIGLPWEGASPVVIRRRAGPRLEQCFTPWGRGQCSDDTDHTRLVLQALAVDPECGPSYSARLARGLRGWFLSLPVGMGLGTARACMKLLVGLGPERSGVFSAGNGPVMRAPILGAFRQDLEWLRRAVKATTRITHTDPLAEEGALLAARLAAISVDRPVSGADVTASLEPGAVADAVLPVLEGIARGRSPAELVDGRGVSGFVLHTVPAVVAAVVMHPEDFEAAVECAIRLGGDTDTVAAIVGGIVGARVGPEGLPPRWLNAYGDWPWSEAKLRQLAAHVCEGAEAPRVLPLSIVKTPVQLTLALGHIALRYRSAAQIALEDRRSGTQSEG